MRCRKCRKQIKGPTFYDVCQTLKGSLDAIFCVSEDPLPTLFSYISQRFWASRDLHFLITLQKIGIIPTPKIISAKDASMLTTFRPEITSRKDIPRRIKTKRHENFKIKFNSFTFRYTHESNVAKRSKFNLISSLSATHINKMSRKV